MNLTQALPLLFLFGSTAISQSPGRQPPPVSVLKQFSSTTDLAICPVQLKASLYVVGGIAGAQPIENGPTTERDQRIRITLANPSSEIASVRLTIYGFPIGIRVDPAVAYASHDNSGVHDPAEIHKVIAFDGAVAAQQSASIDVSLRDFSLVSSINLNSVSYSDGSIWHPGNGRYCQAVGLPTGALPIDGALIQR